MPSTQAIAEALFQKMLNGELVLGQQITEHSICKMLNVPRTHVRGAIQLLIQWHLIEVDRRSRFFITQLKPKQLDALFVLIIAMTRKAINGLLLDTPNVGNTGPEHPIKSDDVIQNLIIPLDAPFHSNDSQQFNIQSIDIFTRSIKVTNNPILHRHATFLEKPLHLLSMTSSLSLQQMDILYSQYQKVLNGIIVRDQLTIEKHVIDMCHLRHCLTRLDLHRHYS